MICLKTFIFAAGCHSIDANLLRFDNQQLVWDSKEPASNLVLIKSMTVILYQCKLPKYKNSWKENSHKL